MFCAAAPGFTAAPARADGADLAPPGAVPWEAGTGPAGQIVGRAIDRTAPIHALGGQDVRLAIIERGASAERHVTTDGLGRFAFTGLPVGGIRVFVVSTEHGGVRYQSDRIVLTPSSPTRSVVLVAYEPAPDRSALRVALVFGVVDAARGGVRVSVIQQWLNPTDRTAVTTASDPLAVPLPPGAEAVTWIAGWEHPHVAGGRIEDAVPVLPGTRQVAFAYGLAARRTSLTIPWDFPTGAGDVEILIAQGVRAAADGLRPIGIVTEAGRSYERWSGGPIRPGGHVTVRLSGIRAEQDAWPAAVAGGFAAVLAAGLWRAFRRPRAGTPPGIPAG